jgi:hypothetical protein
MNKPSRYRWSLSSIAITIVTALTTLAVIQHSYYLGEWRERSPLGMTIATIGGISVLVSFILGIIALVRDEPPLLAIFALLLSMYSLTFYTG